MPQVGRTETGAPRLLAFRRLGEGRAAAATQSLRAHHAITALTVYLIAPRVLAEIGLTGLGGRRAAVQNLVHMARSRGPAIRRAGLKGGRR